MARPSPKIITSIEVDDGTTWDILKVNNQYTITYQGQPCGIRQHYSTLSTHGFKYQKLSYTNYGNAQAQARRLNTKFNCEDFAVKAV
jgi:hypothetical protein